MNPENLYQQLEKLSLPFIQNYHADLTKHDRKYIMKNPGIPFLHFTGSCGTYLIPMLPADHEAWPAQGEIVPYLFGRADRWHILRGKIQEVEYIIKESDRRKMTLHFDGKRLKKITLYQAHQIIKEYYLQVQNQWRRKMIAA